MTNPYAFLMKCNLFRVRACDLRVRACVQNIIVHVMHNAHAVRGYNRILT